MDFVATPKERRRLHVKGMVQGVGFRPFVYRIAALHHVTGHVCNQRGNVLIEIQGTKEQIEQFIQDLLGQVEKLARIESLTMHGLPLEQEDQFTIQVSVADGQSICCFPPDLAICPHCISDLTVPHQRYYQYPFTSCIYCGPRYSIIQDLPYDRPSTTMQPFLFCEACQQEYEDPSNRRFHAQTIACPACGPTIQLRDSKQMLVTGNWQEKVQEAFLTGKILAVKGIGGFHLMCDASNTNVISALRKRKRRPRKPLAIMARDLQTVEQNFNLTPMEREILASPRAPIVLLEPKPILQTLLPIESIAPGYQRMGVMLSYTPMHALLFSDSISYLVATSGNQSGFPIAKTNEEASRQLAHIADFFLFHNRDIAIRVEDSVCQVIDEQVSLIRRSRGYVPESLDFPTPPTCNMEIPTVLAIGAEMKNTFCFLHKDQAIISHHIGEIEHQEQLACFREGVKHVERLLGAEPDIIAYDPHPGYILSQEAAQEYANKPLIPVYHHHAHMVSCMAEHGLTAPVIGCILDGTGFGPDGQLWGFEILAGDYLRFERLFHLKPLSLPGGEASIRSPWRMAVSLYYDMMQDTERTERWARQFFPEFEEQLPLLLAQLDGRISCPKVSSAGRLFDAVSALLGLCLVSTYEGEAASLLGEQAESCFKESGQTASYPFAAQEGEWVVGALVQALLNDLHHSEAIETMAQKFHYTIVEMLLQGVHFACQKTGIRAVVLSGGVWNNRYLLMMMKTRLRQEGFEVYTHQKIPAGDGGIAFGQAVSALWRWHQNVSVCSSEDH